MFPVLLAIGPFELRTLSLISALAFFVMAFVFWRKGREEHYDMHEYFDGFILASILGFVVGRLGFIGLNWERFGFNIVQYFDSMAYPGISSLLAVIAASVYLYLFAKKRKWDAFEVLDFWALAAVNGALFLHIGLFLDGTHFGTLTNLPVGLVFPGTQEPHHPVQLYSVLFYLALALYLAWVEYRYRTFSWYRGGKKNANSGFLFVVAVLAVSIWFFATSWVRMPISTVLGSGMDRILASVGFAIGLVLLFYRGGILGVRKKPAASMKQKEPVAPVVIEKTDAENREESVDTKSDA